jgi:hypothetical protein
MEWDFINVYSKPMANRGVRLLENVAPSKSALDKFNTLWVKQGYVHMAIYNL